ncbi:MAG TPA: hypothetical protein VI729_11565, partial [Anaerolineales bacterium]|nr:hypothetical protein [Anaerolineales bacterium]
ALEVHQDPGKYLRDGRSSTDPATAARYYEGVLAGPLPGLPVLVLFKGGLGRQLEAVRRLASGWRRASQGLFPGTRP